MRDKKTLSFLPAALFIYNHYEEIFRLIRLNKSKTLRAKGSAVDLNLFCNR